MAPEHAETRLSLLNPGQLFHMVNNPDIISKIRKLEGFNKKLISQEYGILFNKTCLNEGLLPKYTNFRLHDPAAQNEPFTINCRKQLLKLQLD